MVTFKQQMALDVATFARTDEFGELMSYTSPAGVITNNVLVVAAKQNFVQEYDNYAGLGASLAVARNTINNVEIHGKLTSVDGSVFVVQQLYGIDDDFIMVSAVADVRISPAGMRQ